MTTPRAPGQRRLRILTWHVHGNYLYSLTKLPHDFFIPVTGDGRAGYRALGSRMPWGLNVTEIPAREIGRNDFDCIIYQSRSVYENDRFQLLNPSQLVLPSVYLEHDPPLSHPTAAVHPFRHERGTLVHVTHYNDLAWDAGPMPSRVVEHGVPVRPGLSYTGEVPRGVVVVNGLVDRGRRMGVDLFEWTRAQVPLDLIGMKAEELGGLGELPNMAVGPAMAHYRFFYTPNRYTSLSLALVEAMLLGIPIVGIAATELPTVILNGVSGFVHNDRKLLVDVMRQLLQEPELARQWGAAGRRTALERFGMDRFIQDWNAVLHETMG